MNFSSTIVFYCIISNCMALYYYIAYIQLYHIIRFSLACSFFYANFGKAEDSLVHRYGVNIYHAILVLLPLRLRCQQRKEFDRRRFQLLRALLCAALWPNVMLLYLDKHRAQAHGLGQCGIEVLIQRVGEKILEYEIMITYEIVNWACKAA